MFNSLTGVITYKGINQLFLATQGVEWDIQTTASSLSAWPGVGQEGRVFVYLYHREDSMKLFGFARSEERALFFELIKVEGLGPKLAQKILSAVSAQEFAAVIEREDLGALEALPGLGKKTAQKIVLHLKGRLADVSSGESGPALVEDLVNALAGMGFDKKASREAVIRALKDDDNGRPAGDPRAREQEIFKLALALVSREGRKP
jgi:Holliday junction DNA helicase RuvA